LRALAPLQIGSAFSPHAALEQSSVSAFSSVRKLTYQAARPGARYPRDGTSTTWNQKTLLFYLSMFAGLGSKPWASGSVMLNASPFRRTAEFPAGWVADTQDKPHGILIIVMPHSDGGLDAGRISSSFPARTLIHLPHQVDSFKSTRALFSAGSLSNQFTFEGCGCGTAMRDVAPLPGAWQGASAPGLRLSGS
jgi:hypothetical protein